MAVPVVGTMEYVSQAFLMVRMTILKYSDLIVTALKIITRETPRLYPSAKATNHLAKLLE